MMERIPRTWPIILIYALGVLAVGVWRDLAFAGRTDLLRDALSTAIVLVFGAIVGDVALSAEEALLVRRGLWPRSKLLFLLRLAAMSAGWMMLGHLLTPTIAMLAQIPRAGLSIVPTILLGLEFELRQALLPALVMGAGVGAVVGPLLVRRASQPGQMRK
jgi:hypothetical protein